MVDALANSLVDGLVDNKIVFSTGNVKISLPLPITMALIINEIFYSIQGEGVFTGAPTIFIRTTGCNLRCNWCDTSYAFEDGVEMTIEDIIKEVNRVRHRTGCRRTCITGGEPLLQDEAEELILKLLSYDYHVTLETNGSFPIQPLLEHLEKHPEWRGKLLVSLDIKCPSSGELDKNYLDNIGMLAISDQLKFVVQDKRDMDFVFYILKEYPVSSPIIIQPVSGADMGNEKLEALIENLLNRDLQGLDIRFMLQLHKIIWGNRKGV